jgi:hypothetical protein
VPGDGCTGATTQRPFVIAIDGRRHRLAPQLLRLAQLMRDEVLVPPHAGRSVNYRPSAWEQRGRPGAIEIPAGLAVVWLEGRAPSDAT